MSLKGSVSGENTITGRISNKQSLSASAEKINVIKGESAYQLAVVHGFRGTEEEWLESLKGANGKSAYETAVEGGFKGTEEEFAEMLANAGTGGGGGIVNETDPTVPSWAKQPQKPTYTASEVGAVGTQQLPQAINTALAQAKASGDFDGKDGADGVSPTVTTSKSGKVTTIKITDKNGTKTATINDGADGANGTNGTNGKDGTSVTITKITESSASGGTNTVTFSDGKTLSIKNGKDGKDGEGGSGGIGNDPIVIGDSDGQHTKVDIGSITLAEGEEYHVKMTGSTTDDLDECLLLEGKSGNDVQLRGLLAPTANNDAATKAYVDGKATKSGVGLSNVDNVKQYSASNPPPYPVKSVNGKTGAVTVTVPTKMSELENDNDYAQLDDFASWAKASTKPTYTKSEVGLGNVDNVKQYSASNPPPYPVTSVNGKTGAVTVTVPSKVSQLTNDSNFISSIPSEYVTETELEAKGYLTSYTESDPTVPDWAKAASKPTYSKSEVGLGNVENVKQYSASNPPPYPVTSVNGKTGAVTVSVPTKVSQLTNDSEYIIIDDVVAQLLDSSEEWTFTLANGSTVTKKVVLG